MLRFDRHMLTLTDRQAIPRNLTVSSPVSMSLETHQPVPSNNQFGRPRSVNQPIVPDEPPVNTTPPVISATATTPGGIVSLDTPGVWTGDNLVFAYQWQVNGADEVGQTNEASFDTTSLVAGDEVTLVEIATNSTGSVFSSSNVITITAP